MDNVDLQVLRQVSQWCTDGRRVVLGTITRTWGSAPRPPGSVVAIRDDGMVTGSVSGGCIEDDLIDKAREGVLASGMPKVVRYGIDADAAHRFGLPCGGLIELVLEPVLPRTRIGELLERLSKGERVRRVLTIASGEVVLEPAGDTDELQLTDTTLTTHHGPRWRLVLIGAGQMTQYLAQMARALDYEVIVCDPRDEYATGFAIEGATLVAPDARRPAGRDQARRPHRDHRADPRPQARRPVPDGGAAQPRVLRRRDRLARQPGQAQATADRALRR